MERNAEAEVADLVRRLTAMAEGFDQVRALGLSVSVPPELYQACLAIVRRHEGEGGPGPGSPLAAADTLQDVPLRKLLFQVIEPGEYFTVPEIAERLSALGVSAPPNKISNALGSWVKGGRLVRERKGLYFCPLPGREATRQRVSASSREELTEKHGTEKKAI